MTMTFSICKINHFLLNVNYDMLCISPFFSSSLIDHSHQALKLLALLTLMVPLPASVVWDSAKGKYGRTTERCSWAL